MSGSVLAAQVVNEETLIDPDSIQRLTPTAELLLGGTSVADRHGLLKPSWLCPEYYALKTARFSTFCFELTVVMTLYSADELSLIKESTRLACPIWTSIPAQTIKPIHARNTTEILR
jgi:hypothetical protein